MFRLIFKLVRAVVLIGMAGAVAAKFLLESNADPDTEEIDLVAIFEGKRLVSAAAPFYGGKVFAMFGGVVLDFRNAEPAPTGVELDVLAVMAGVSVVVPEGWRAVFDGDVYLGGWSDETGEHSDEDAPTLRITGTVALGGIQATTRSPVEERTT